MRWGNRRGQSAVELALMLPILLTLLAVLFDVGRGFSIYLVITHAAREGAWVGSQLPGNAQAMQAAVMAEIQEAGLNPGNVSVNVTPGESGSPVSVTVEYQYTPILSGFLPGGGSLQIEATEMMVGL